jgi:hypothetical protein
VSFEDLGTLGSILFRRGYDVRYLDVPVASLADVDPLAPDLLVVLGAPISIRSSRPRSSSSRSGFAPAGRRSASASAAS